MAWLQGSVFCEAGLFLQDSYEEFLLVGHAVYLGMAETAMRVVRMMLGGAGLAGVATEGIVISWPSDVILTSICHAKDMSAHLATGLTSLVNGVQIAVLSDRSLLDLADEIGIVRAIRQSFESVSAGIRGYTGTADQGSNPEGYRVVQADIERERSGNLLTYRDEYEREEGADVLDSEIVAASTVKTAAIGQMLMQFFLSGPMAMLAAERIVMCASQKLVSDPASVFGLNISITSTNPALASQDACFQGLYASRLSKRMLTGGILGNEGADQSILTGVAVSGIELVKHTATSATSIFYMAATTMIDTVATWAIGLLTGLQDVMYTQDAANCRMPGSHMDQVASPLFTSEILP